MTFCLFLCLTPSPKQLVTDRSQTFLFTLIITQIHSWMIQKENAFQSKVASTFRNVSGQRTGAEVALTYALDQKEENTGSADVAQYQPGSQPCLRQLLVALDVTQNWESASFRV